MKNIAEDEIIRLAKENSPRLLSKFKILYPEFFEKLAQIQSNLQNSELIFCIYLKLNLTTKEIATYTFVTPKAVQNRKNRIRKKLNIASTVDIYKWFDENL
ncbi:LuxR C-terminal-related transcriptional regulator [Chryseobacterium sp. 09-1422]|jgi:DNA-binding CsgD family transcriptional regulator|uniref:LuxR C-terminal-related transcriptional regulator n=1 Tax=Chryseobacterium kimseyorum TaxID=2984028 RepID=A0ABT3HU17_9FLAO|nr:LuxR C-terminal-related transcriptional regulator [Chryseobacterium kimseyorum]MCW3167280.1 LuxR C-terminal-related transcriptional regulator [Chryseobacterium kimseyorum]